MDEQPAPGIMDLFIAIIYNRTATYCLIIDILTKRGEFLTEWRGRREIAGFLVGRLDDWIF